MQEGEGQVLMGVGGCVVPGTELDIIHPLIPPSHCVLREGWFICGQSVSLLQSIGALGIGRRGLYLLEVCARPRD